MRTLNPDSRGTGLGTGRGREAPSRPRKGPLADEQPSEAPELHRPSDRPREARTADPTPEFIPGQTELPLTYRQVTLWSL